MKKYTIVTLGDVCQTISATYRGTHDEVILINTSDVFNGEILNHLMVKNEKLPGQFKKTFQQKDILYSEIRPANKHFAFVDISDTKQYIASTKLMVIRAKTEKILPEFLYILLTSPQRLVEFQQAAETRSGTFPQITFQCEVAPTKIMLPDIQTQQKIVSCIKMFSEKIKVLSQINHNLEEQAKAIFEEMFPNILRGENCIGDIITPKRGKGLLSKDAVFGDIPVIAGGLEPATFHNVSNTHPPVLTISASGANAGYVSLWTIPVWSSDSSFIDSSMTNNVYFWYVLLKKRQKEIFESQTGSAQPHIYPQHIAQMPLANISGIDVDAYTKVVTPFFETIGENKKQSVRLAQLRDTLLPKLMSGEIDVSEVEI